MYQFWNYLIFLLSSTNQHGVHSPFVFDFVTKGLYKKCNINKKINDYSEFKNLSKREKIILSKIINYFKIDDVLVDSNKLSKTLNEKCILLYFNNIICLSSFQLKILKENNIVLVKGIYNNKQNTKIWTKFLESTPNIISINLFYFGIIFYRPQQAKEHFKIRV